MVSIVMSHIKQKYLFFVFYDRRIFSKKKILVGLYSYLRSLLFIHLDHFDTNQSFESTALLTFEKLQYAFSLAFFARYCQSH